NRVEDALNEPADMTLIQPGESASTAILAHDGDSAHLVTGSGGLSVGSGDFFAGQVFEHIRLTAEGNVGIGVSNPQARLDVDGLIRATGGIVFPDGTVQYSAAKKTLGAQSSQSPLKPSDNQIAQVESPSATTTSFIPKFSDNSGALTDSVMF